MARPTKKLRLPAGPAAPQDPQECASAIATYGRLEADRARLVDEMNERIRNIGNEYQQRISDIEESLKNRLQAIQIYCEAHRVALTDDNGVKYAEFTTGRVEWRKAPDSIVAPQKEENLDTVIDLLEKRGLARFIRIKKEISKAAMLLEKEHLKALIAGIPGLSLKIGKETFCVKPLEVDPT